MLSGNTLMILRETICVELDFIAVLMIILGAKVATECGCPLQSWSYTLGLKYCMNIGLANTFTYVHSRARRTHGTQSPNKS